MEPIDIGFGTILREKLRLHGIDTPEIETPEGQEAFRYVAGVLKPGTPIVIRSYASDMYGRFVADIVYSESPSSSGTVDLQSIIFLNADLLAKGLAIRMVET